MYACDVIEVVKHWSYTHWVAKNIIKTEYSEYRLLFSGQAQFGSPDFRGLELAVSVLTLHFS